MLREGLKQRRDVYERKLRDATYELTVLDDRRELIEKALSELSGAISEIDKILRDLNAQAAIEAAEENTNG